MQAAKLLLYSTPGSTAQTVQGWYQSCSLGRTQLTSQSSQVSTAVSWGCCQAEPAQHLSHMRPF
jgi:hypothetical protein